jgi:hypothetical protein
MDTQAPNRSSQAGGLQWVLASPTKAAISITTRPWPSENSAPQ